MSTDQEEFVNESDKDFPIPYRFGEEFEDGTFIPAVNLEKNDERMCPYRENMLQWIELSIIDPEKRGTVTFSAKLSETYITYSIYSKIIDPEMPGFGISPSIVHRRYSEFKFLRNYLETIYSAIIVPPLPEKKIINAWQKLHNNEHLDVKFIERRRISLQNFLLRVASHNILSRDLIFFLFATEKGNSWKERAISTEFKSKMELKLLIIYPSLSNSRHKKGEDKKLEETNIYANELYSRLSAIIQVKSKMCDTQKSSYQLYWNLSQQLENWSDLDSKSELGFKMASQSMKSFVQLMENSLDEEEHLNDRFREYQAFAQILKSLCRKLDILHLEADKADENLNNKIAYKDFISNGGTSRSFTIASMKSKLFGSNKKEILNFKQEESNFAHNRINSIKEASVLDQNRNISISTNNVHLSNECVNNIKKDNEYRKGINSYSLEHCSLEETKLDISKKSLLANNSSNKLDLNKVVIIPNAVLDMVETSEKIENSYTEDKNYNSINTNQYEYHAANSINKNSDTSKANNFQHVGIAENKFPNYNKYNKGTNGCISGGSMESLIRIDFNKLKLAEEQVEMARTCKETTRKELESNLQLATSELQRFNEQKVKDIREIFLQYATSQVEQCKNNITIWQSIQEGFNKI